jgi:hypothetical protein
MYPIDLHVDYSDDYEYKSTITYILGDAHEKFDEIVEYIYAQTIHQNDNKHYSDLWCELFKKAAGTTLLSENEKMGIVVLFAYENFIPFHYLFSIFMRENTINMELYTFLFQSFVQSAVVQSAVVQSDKIEKEDGLVELEQKDVEKEEGDR